MIRNLCLKLSLLALGLPFLLSASECYTNDSCDHFYVEADWLYWKAEQDQLGFATFTTQTTDGTLTTSSGKLLEQHFKYESGFRTTIGYQPACSCWEVDFGFTYIPGHSNFSDSIIAPNQFITTNNNNIGFFSLTDGLPFDAITSKWRMNLYYYDLDIAFPITWCDCVHLRPHFGLRYLHFDEKLTANLISVTTRGGSFALDNFRFKQRENGVGLEAGLGISWDICWGLTLKGHVGGSILCSNYRTKGRLNEVVDDLVDVTELNNSYRSSIKSTLPTLDYFLGVGYCNSFCDTTYYLQAGWEQFVLFDSNRIASNGNLSFQGFTLRGGLVF